jgi:hypothetical protein
MGFRTYLVVTIMVALLIWGPINHSWPAWLAIRIGYLIVVPTMVWLLLRCLWNYWQPNSKTEIVLERILSGLICVTLFTLAFLEATSKMHIDNTKWIQTRDGMEAIGDDIVVKGPDWGNALIIVIIALLVLWFGVLKKGTKSST